MNHLAALPALLLVTNESTPKYARNSTGPAKIIPIVAPFRLVGRESTWSTWKKPFELPYPHGEVVYVAFGHTAYARTKYAALGTVAGGVHVADPLVGGKVAFVVTAKAHCLSSCIRSKTALEELHGCPVWIKKPENIQVPGTSRQTTNDKRQTYHQDVVGFPP